MAGPRSIFEETDAPKAAAKASAPKPRPDAPERQGVIRWLWLLAALVVAMILVGGLTRLTDSGLSITTWRPVTGALPPMNAADWQFEFDLYRASPEFSLQNSAMDLAAFKSIYWWEWSHRQLGRLVGLVWLLGFLWFAGSRSLPRGWTLRLFGIGVLGGAQGALGWWMVSSGLAPGMMDVASLRLALHLGLAFAILGVILWFIFRLGLDGAALVAARRRRLAGPAHWSLALLALGFVQVMLGALVAGIDAGRNYPTWPSMGGDFLPAESFGLAPFWRNFTEDPGAAQFTHRLAAYLLLILAILAWWRTRGLALKALRSRFTFALAAIGAQALLGVLAVLSAAALPQALAHQAGAILAFAVLVAARFAALYPPEQRIRG
jgi:cytochrome c oxidase assembly protein subunit 15